MAGLDPAIHPLKKSHLSLMDARVKPGHDESGKSKHDNQV
jgi:hypothetical protein